MGNAEDRHLKTLMGLFTRFRPARPTVGEGDSLPTQTTPRERALRLIDEGNGIEEQGRYKEAMTCYESAIDLAPTLARGHLNHGNMLMEFGDAEGALKAYATALRHEPGYAAAHFNTGNTHVRLGRPDAALEAYRKALAAKPDFAEVEVATGGVLQNLGQFDQAVASYRRALAINPNYHDAHSNLGDALMALGQFEAAAASYGRATELSPGSEVDHFNLGNALQGCGKLDRAVASYIRALEIKPDFAMVHCNLGNAHRSQGRTKDAMASYDRALQISPDFAEAHYNLGATLQGLARHNEAISSFRRAVEIRPTFAEAHNNLGNSQKAVDQVDNAAASYRAALRSNPDYAEACNNLGNLLKDMGQFDEAIAVYRRALIVKPDFAQAHSNLGNALTDLGRIDDAIASYRRAVEINPDSAEAHSNLGNAYSKLRQFDAAIASYRRALHVDPNYFGAYNNLGNALQDLGQAEEAVSSYRRALAIKPDFADAHSSLLFCLSHNEAMGIQALLAEHRRFGEQFEAPLRASWPQHGNGRDAERCLQVGFVSGDLRDHAVAYFLEPILGYLAAYPGLSLHAYYNHATEGSITPRLRNHFRHWHRIAGLSDAALAQKIAADGIDILIDLSGHTGENRLLCFARKPAPVQVSWMGYPGTTGLSAMDYYLADRYFLPPGKFDDQFTEKLVHLPASAPFLPDRRAPPVNALPALSNGYLTFGSFNRLSKLTASAVAMWSRLLQALPDARMVIGGMPKDGSSAMLVDWFARGGVARDRLSFHPRCDVAAYLAMHAQIDICLDTFPYTGGTTTNHALWMGVPTLTLAGQTVSSRQGAAILGHVGLEAFVADDADDFQKKGLYWAGDPVALAAVRAGLRARCTQSPIRSPELIAAGLEHALRTMWRRWCARLPAETFEARPQLSM
jgi:protein O-GlcNAc transferase